jgi:hypothetical protein
VAIFGLERQAAGRMTLDLETAPGRADPRLLPGDDAAMTLLYLVLETAARE